GSTDGTEEIVLNLSKNRKINYFYEPSECGIAELRNFGIKKVIGEYVFFTDGDCIPSKYWLEEGIKVLEIEGCVGVEGKTYYESQQKVTVSDYNTHNLVAEGYMTCNIAYARNVLEKVNYFDPAFKYGHEDRDLAFRVKKFGNICFSRYMLVFHQKKKLSVKGLFCRAKRAENMVYFIKKHGKYTDVYRNILYPKTVLFILCPPLLILTDSYLALSDLIFVFFKYLSLIYERIFIWKAAIKNRIFII
ncbi:MAG: glycosyltransferase family A protein, partial [Candidatus Brocadiales bacterium]|nr:glycosyltransferase family A protein [Candidatus Brocadiales bacterium]